MGLEERTVSNSIQQAVGTTADLVRDVSRSMGRALSNSISYWGVMLRGADIGRWLLYHLAHQ